MPTYDYHCDACSKDYEMFQAITAQPVKKCPHCGKKKARRLIGTGGGIIFKGSGFYCTDYRDSGPGGNGKRKSESAASESSKSEPAKAESSAAKPADSSAKPAESAKAAGKK